MNCENNNAILSKKIELLEEMSIDNHTEYVYVLSDFVENIKGLHNYFSSLTKEDINRFNRVMLNHWDFNSFRGQNVPVPSGLQVPPKNPAFVPVSKMTYLSVDYPITSYTYPFIAKDSIIISLGSKISLFTDPFKELVVNNRLLKEIGDGNVYRKDLVPRMLSSGDNYHKFMDISEIKIEDLVANRVIPIRRVDINTAFFRAWLDALDITDPNIIR